MFSFIWARINGWVNNRKAGDLRRHRANCDVILMTSHHLGSPSHILVNIMNGYISIYTAIKYVTFYWNDFVLLPLIKLSNIHGLALVNEEIYFVLNNFIFRVINGIKHRPYSRQVTEWMECDVAIHPPPSVYPKAGNGALRGHWAMKYHCKNDSPTIVFTVRDLVHQNYVTPENIPHVCKSWNSLLNYVLATHIFLFIRHSLHCN